MPMTKLTNTGDPEPLPPRAPDDNECCRSGCPICVFDLYQDELDAYRLALAAWHARQDAPKPA